jgi:hypothetical protein
MTKIGESESGPRSISQRHGSADPDQHQNVIGSATLVSGLFGFLQVQSKERGEDVGAAAAHLPLQAAHPGHGEADRRHPPHGGDGGGQEHSGRPVLAPPSLPGTFNRELAR